MRLVQLIKNIGFNPEYEVLGENELLEIVENSHIEAFFYKKWFQRDDENIEKVRNMLKYFAINYTYLSENIPKEPSHLEERNSEQEEKEKNLKKLKWWQGKEKKRIQGWISIVKEDLDPIRKLVKNIDKAKIEIYQPEESSNFIKDLKQRKIPYFQIDVEAINDHLYQLYSQFNSQQ